MTGILHKCKAPKGSAVQRSIATYIYIFYKTAEIQARQGERAFMTGILHKCKAPKGSAVQRSIATYIYIFYKTAEIQARQGERVFMTGVYTDVNDRNKAQFNAVLQCIHAI